MFEKKTMAERILIILLLLLFLPCAVYANSQCAITTVPKEVTYPADWISRPIVKSSGVIPPGGEITMSLGSEGWGCSPFTWSVSGEGYTLDKTVTKSGFETVNLRSSGGT